MKTIILSFIIIALILIPVIIWAKQAVRDKKKWEKQMKDHPLYDLSERKIS